MSENVNLWLALPSAENFTLNKFGISWTNAHRVGGLRQYGARFERETFELDRDGVPALLIPCWCEVPSVWDMIDDPWMPDIVAVDIHNPKRWQRRTALSSWIGEEMMYRRRALAEELPPLRVFRHPLDWIKADGQGIVPIDEGTFVAAVTAVPPRKLVTSTVDDGKWLRAMILKHRNIGQPVIGLRKDA